jgi:3-hydroxyacyl-[acyl-carrier-protein] dehydratase
LSHQQDEVVVKLADRDHPVFQAHFPTKPILPGFLQIEIIADILGDKVAQINYGKFRQHILPEDVITYRMHTRADGYKKITLYRDHEKVSEIRYAVD